MINMNQQRAKSKFCCNIISPTSFLTNIYYFICLILYDFIAQNERYSHSFLLLEVVFFNFSLNFYFGILLSSKRRHISQRIRIFIYFLFILLILYSIDNYSSVYGRTERNADLHKYEILLSTEVHLFSPHLLVRTLQMNLRQLGESRLIIPLIGDV